MSIWSSGAYEDKDKKLKTSWQVTVQKNEKMLTSTIVNKASWEFLITAIVFSQHLENILEYSRFFLVKWNGIFVIEIMDICTPPKV